MRFEIRVVLPPFLESACSLSSSIVHGFVAPCNGFGHYSRRGVFAYPEIQSTSFPNPYPTPTAANPPTMTGAATLAVNAVTAVPAATPATEASEICAVDLAALLIVLV